MYCAVLCSWTNCVNLRQGRQVVDPIAARRVSGPSDVPSSRDTLLLTPWRPFSAKRTAVNQASCTLHLTITNSICSLNAQGALKHLPSSQRPREPR